MRNSSRNRRVLAILTLLLLIPAGIIYVGSRDRPISLTSNSGGPGGAADALGPSPPARDDDDPDQAGTPGPRSTPVATHNGVVTLRGRVLRPDGSGAAAARVSLRYVHLAVPPVQSLDPFTLHRRRKPPFFKLPESVRANGRGEYEFSCEIEPKDAALPLSRFRLSAYRDGLLASTLLPDLAGPEVALPDLVLEEGVFIRLRYLDLDDAPIAEVDGRLTARRTALRPGTTQRLTERRLLAARGDDRGHIVFGPLPNRSDWQLELTSDHPDHPPSKGKRLPADLLDGDEVVVRLERGCTMYGSVLDAERNPVVGAWVMPAELRHGPIKKRIVATDERGWFTLKGVPVGFIRPLVFVGPNPEPGPLKAFRSLPWAFEEFIAESGDPVDVGSLVLTPPGHVTGTLLSPTGQPVADMEIYVLGPDDLTAMASETDESGAFDISLPAGNYEMFFPDTDEFTFAEVRFEIRAGKQTKVRPFLVER